MSEWQPIETAPKDGTAILAYCPGSDTPIYVICWDDYVSPLGRTNPPIGWREAGGEQYETFEPTHWMPLPEPPK